MNRGLKRFLHHRGVSRAEAEAAESEGVLTLLTLDRLLLPGRPQLNSTEVAQRSGISPDVATLLWRALGFPDVPDEVPAFTDESVEVLRLLHSNAEATTYTDASPENLVASVRAIGAGLSRVAEAMSDQIADAVIAARAQCLDDATVAAVMAENIDWAVLSRLNDYALRVQLRAAVRRKLLAPPLAPGQVPSLAVGFVDLVGYTAISQELDGRELATLVTRFESVAYDTVAELGARLVKTIGDEVMFVTEDPEIALRVALALTARTGADDLLPRARAGLAFGPALAREGDYYGAVVNLAHRLVEISRPTTAVVSAEFAEALSAHPEFDFQRLRSRRIRGIGKVEIFGAAPATVGGSTAATGFAPKSTG